MAHSKFIEIIRFVFRLRLNSLLIFSVGHRFSTLMLCTIFFCKRPFSSDSSTSLFRYSYSHSIHWNTNFFLYFHILYLFTSFRHIVAFRFMVFPDSMVFFNCIVFPNSMIFLDFMVSIRPIDHVWCPYAVQFLSSVVFSDSIIFSVS